MRSTVDARSRISNRDLIVDKITNIIADQIDKTLICQVHIGVLTLKLGLGDARPQQPPSCVFRNVLNWFTGWCPPLHEHLPACSHPRSGQLCISACASAHLLPGRRAICHTLASCKWTENLLRLTDHCVHHRHLHDVEHPRRMHAHQPSKIVHHQMARALPHHCCR